jgi:AMP nucleosidase
MKEKKDTVENWQPLYTGTPLAEFGAYVLPSSLDNCAKWFATPYGAAVKGLDRPMPNVTSDGITLVAPSGTFLVRSAFDQRRHPLPRHIAQN